MMSITESLIGPELDFKILQKLIEMLVEVNKRVLVSLRYLLSFFICL